MKGDTGLATLKPLIGKYPQDGGNFLQEGILADRLKALLGERYDTLVKNMGTVGPLTKEGGRLSLIGNRPHEGGKEAAAIVIDTMRDGLRVWLLTDGQQYVFTDLKNHTIPWTPEVQKVIANAAEMPATAASK